MSRRTLSAVVAGGVTLALLALALRNVQLGQVWVVVSGARLGWLVPMAAIGVLDLAIRAARWRILLSRSGRRPSVYELLKLEAIGLAVNNVLFMRLGELARSFLAARELGLPVATVLASVAVERALDVAALLTLFAFASAGVPELVPGPARHGALLALAGAVGALVFLALAEGPLQKGRWAEAALRRWPRLHDLVVQLAAGAAVLRAPWQAAQAVALSLALWGADGLMFWSAARALDLGWAVSYGRSILVLSWAGAVSALPAAPGALGTFEAAVKSILEKFGVAPDSAFGYAFFTHMVMYLLVTALGLAYLYRVGLSLGELQAALAAKEKKSA